jgi:hypothetical protein
LFIHLKREKTAGLYTIIGPIQVLVASELISTAGAAAAADMQSKVSGKFKILGKSFGGCVMAGER